MTVFDTDHCRMAREPYARSFYHIDFDRSAWRLDLGEQTCLSSRDRYMRRKGENFGVEAIVAVLERLESVHLQSRSKDQVDDCSLPDALYVEFDIAGYTRLEGVRVRWSFW